MKTLYFYSIRSTEWNPDAYEEAKIDIWFIFWKRFRKDGGENTGSGKFHVRIDQGLSLSYYKRCSRPKASARIFFLFIR